MGIISTSDCELNDAGAFRGYDDEQRNDKDDPVNEEKNIWRRVVALKDSVLSIGEKKNACTYCSGPHAHWRCPTRPPYSETRALIQMATQERER